MHTEIEKVKEFEAKWRKGDFDWEDGEMRPSLAKVSAFIAETIEGARQDTLKEVLAALMRLENNEYPIEPTFRQMQRVLMNMLSPTEKK